jgi:pimeloyl-ACP methyl ester carboxylesterase
MRILAVTVCLALLTGCATRQPIPTDAAFASAEASLRAARSTGAPTNQRIANYLAAASIATDSKATGAGADAARTIYNIACAEMTVLLRSADKGSYWNRPLHVAGRGGEFELSVAPASRVAWSPDEFTSFVSSFDVSEKHVTTPNRRSGFGGTLVGVRNLNPREAFATKYGIAGAVTATLEFRGRSALLTLENPVKQSAARIAGVSRPLAADFSAPLCFYPEGDPTLTGLLGGLRPGLFSTETGLYLVQPFDPNRIPVVFVHGLISTPYIWVDPINKLQMDPVLRERYQALVFAYPTGNPVAYSALQFRQSLAKFEKAHHLPNGYLIVSHSLGGLLAQMQVTRLSRSTWERTEGAMARDVLSKMKPGSIIEQMFLIKPNPQIKRVVFIATPHRGAEMAVGDLAKIAEHLIELPGSLASGIKDSLGNLVVEVSGSTRILPDGVNGLAPSNPLLITMATTQVVPPCHSIIGNRGLPGPLALSSDGIVPYWSSHLSYAKSEVIVPGPHSCYDYPQAIAEMKRILHLHLASLRSE